MVTRDEFEELTHEHREILAAVGAVTVGTAELEATVAELLEVLLQSPVGAIVSYGQPWRIALDTCLAVLKTRPTDDDAERAITLLREAGKVYDRRNAIVHGQWSTAPGRDEHWFSRQGRLGKRADLYMTPTQVTDIAREVFDLVRKLGALLDSWRT